MDQTIVVQYSLIASALIAAVAAFAAAFGRAGFVFGGNLFSFQASGES